MTLKRFCDLLLNRKILIALCLALFLFILYDKFTPNTKKYYIGYNDHLNMKTLEARDRDGNTITISRSVVDYFLENNFLILHGLKSEICAGQSIYDILYDHKIYYIIDTRDDALIILHSYEDYKRHLQINGVKNLQDFTLNDDILGKIHRSNARYCG